MIRRASILSNCKSSSFAIPKAWRNRDVRDMGRDVLGGGSDVAGGGGGAVDSVNGQTGAVVLAASDVGAATTASVTTEASARSAADALLAPLASPALTGNPTVPTQTPTTNSTKAASTAYADAAVAVEAGARSSADALLAPLASPALTGNPTVPTQTAGNNSTRVASTAYVDTRTIARRFERSYILSGAEVGSRSLPPFFVPIASGETLKLIAVRYIIGSGTSLAFRLQRNGADIVGFGTSGSPLSITTAANVTDPTDVTLAADDTLGVILGAAVGTPTDVSISLYFESVA